MLFRSWDLCDLMKGGYGASATFQAAADYLVHYAKLIERAVASVTVGELLEQSSMELNQGLCCYLVR